MKALTTFSSAILFFLAPAAQAAPDGTWTVMEHRSITPSSDLMLDAHVLPDGITGMIGGGDIVFFTWDGGRHWYNSILPGFPDDQDILGLCAVSRDSVWAACDYGWLARTTDGGAAWEVQRPTTTNMFEVFFLDHLRGWAGGSTSDGSNHLVRTADGGATWEDASFGWNGNVIVAIFFIDPETGWAGGKDSEGYPCLYRTDDGGLTWSRQDLPPLPYNSAVESVEFFDPGSGWVATNNSQSPGYLLYTEDGGDYWAVNTTLPLQYTRFDPLDPQDLAALSYGGSSWLSTSHDGGQTWAHVQTPMSGYVPALAHFDGQVAISGGSSCIIGTDDDGASWSILSNSGIDFESMAWAGGSQAFCAGDGSLYSSPDGECWSGVQGPQGGRYVFFHDGMTGWVLDPDQAMPVVWRTADGGAAWAPSTPGHQFDACGIFLADASTGWVYGADGSIYRSTDSGASWSVQDPGTGMDVRDAFFCDAVTGWVAGGTGSSSFVSHTSDGVSWQLQQLPSSCASITAVSFTDPLYGRALSATGTVCGTSDGGQTWSTLSQVPEGGCLDILMADAASGWVLAGGGARIYFTGDGGASWSLDWEDSSCGLLGGFAKRADGTFWAFGSEATVLAFEPDPTSISETMAPTGTGFSLSIIGNPVSGSTALLSLSCPDGGEASVGLYDMAGRLVASSGPVRLSAGGNCIQLDLSGLCNGMYHLRYESGALSGTRKLLIVR